MANAQYFHSLMPKFSYKTYVIFFVTITFAIANFGLTNIITYSVPILMFLYPLAIVLILLTFLSPLFKHAQLVYITTISVTFVIGFFDGLKSLAESLGIDYFAWMQPIITLFEKWITIIWSRTRLVSASSYIHCYNWLDQSIPNEQSIYITTNYVK